MSQDIQDPYESGLYDELDDEDDAVPSKGKNPAVIQHLAHLTISVL